MCYGDLVEVSLDDIISEDNRKYTNEEGFDQLVNSIAQYGIIEPPVLRRQKDGKFKIIAGRRRIAAARQIGSMKAAYGLFPLKCMVIQYDDLSDDEELALTENVNRLNMHPLDEAAAFGRMAKKGATVEEISKYYARSPSAIYQRLRIGGLAEELKGVFRDGRMNISAAAVLAELPDEDQKEFFEKYCRLEEGEEYDEDIHNISPHEVCVFYEKKRRFTIKEIMAAGCDGCAKRTHNSGNTLFEEYDYLDDVCFDGDCYRRKWKGIIEAALAKEHGAMKGIPTDNKILFDGIPELLYKKATHAEFFFADEEARFEVLREKDYEFDRGTKRKNGCCWEILTDYHGALEVRRIGYNQRPPKENNGIKEFEGKTTDKNTLVNDYGSETMNALAKSRDIPTKELTEKIRKEFNTGWNFKGDIARAVYYDVIERRVTAEKDGVEPPEDLYFTMFLEELEEEVGYTMEEDGFTDKSLNNPQKDWLKKLTGWDSLKKGALSLDDEVLKVFHFLLISYGFLNDVPDLDDLKGKKYKDSIFWKYARISADEYRELYLKKAEEIAAKALEPKTKKNLPGHNPGSAKGQGMKVKGGRKKKTGAVRKCRVCGCTDDDCSQCVEKTGEPCHWVEDDLCSACLEE
jgi:ParB/RepB/Spo0J family partition protein